MEIRRVAQGTVPVQLQVRFEQERNVALAQRTVQSTTTAVADAVAAGRKIVTPSPKVIRQEKREQRGHGQQGGSGQRGGQFDARS